MDAKIELPLDIGRDFKSNVFRKAAHTGLLLNFSAICPYRWKIGLINSTGHTTFCYSSYSFTKEIEFLRDLFRQDGYPGVTFEKCVKCFVDSKFIPCKKHKRESANSLLYHTLNKHLLTNCWQNLLRGTIMSTHKEFLFIEMSYSKILKANIVNKFSCLCDINISFIGKTKRHLGTRIKEHRSEKSAIGQHLQTCYTCVHNFNEISVPNILSTGNSDFDCKIREVLLIKSEKPTLNQHLFQNDFILCVFK